MEIHTLELGRYTLTEADLATADMLDCWLYWLLHAHEYEPAALLTLLPQQAIRQATEALARIAQISEDKAMYDAREKAIRDRKWELNAAFREGKIEGKIKGELKGKMEGKIELIRALQGILQTSVSEEQELRAMTLEQLESLTSGLREQLRTARLRRGHFGDQPGHFVPIAGRHVGLRPGLFQPTFSIAYYPPIKEGDCFTCRGATSALSVERSNRSRRPKQNSSGV